MSPKNIYQAKRTNNLLYANGQPWDLQDAAGANTQIQYNLGNNFYVPFGIRIFRIIILNRTRK